jgi:tetratricopeptide (TPR) repeat protein
MADQWIRGWLGDIYREEGRLREALPYYESVRRDGLVAYGVFRLGQIYEALDRPDEAADAYKTFLQAWEEVDPDLARKGEAQAALERLIVVQG